MTLKTPLLARLGSARSSSSSSRSSMRRVRVMEADLSFAARLKHNPHMHQEALIRSDAQRLMMKLSTYGPVPDVAISTCGSAPQAARTALSQDIAPQVRRRSPPSTSTTQA